MEPVRIEIILDDRASQGANRARRQVAGISKEAKKAQREMDELNKTADSMDKTFKRLAGAFAIKELVSKITSVRGEFQQLEVAFKTMLGSAAKANELLDQLVRTAATTPFGLEDVATGAKQLLAYGMEAEKVNETLVRLGDIAAGLGTPLNDLVYLYGTTMAQGRMYTQDLNQFTGRGIPMLSELAKQFGVAESKVKELVEAGKVGFPEVQQVIENLTNEGGKFGGLMEAQSKTITGQISNIEDALYMMFNEIGQQQEGIINSTLSNISYVIENYERFGRILMGLVATYGVYRTAVMTVVACKGWATAAEALHYHWLLLVEKAQKILNATMLANPYVLVATLLAGVAVALISAKTETERLKEAEEDYEQQKQKVIEAEDEHRRKIEELCSIAGDEAMSTDTRREALNRLEMKYPDIFAKYDTEYEKLKNVKKIKEEIAALDGKASITKPENELADTEKKIQELTALSKQQVRKHRYVQDKNHPGRTNIEYYYVDRNLTSKEAAEYKTLTQKRDSLKTQVRKNEVNAYFENLTGISNETLTAQIKYREELLAQMQLQGKNYGKVQGNSNTNGVYNKDELQYQINKLRSEQNRRNKPNDSSADWATEAKKKHQDALKAYNDFISDTSNNLTQEEFEKKAKTLKDAVESAKKEYDKVKPDTDKDAEKSNKAAEKAQREAERRLEIERKLGIELVEAQQENDAAEIEAMDDGIEKKLRQIENDWQQRKNAIDKQESDWKAQNKKAGKGSALTEEQRQVIDDAAELNDAKRQKAIAEAYRAEFGLMRETLREYGTYQQQKLAIATEYSEKIKKAGSEAERVSLGKERDSLLAGVQAQELKANIDWGVVFGEFGGMLHKVMTPVLADAKAYMQTDEFKNADHASQEALVNAVRQMERSMRGADNLSFKRLGNEITAYQNSMTRLREAQEEYKKCYNELQAAQEAYIKVKTEGTEAEIVAAEGALTTAQANEAAAAQNARTLQETAEGAQRAVSATAAGLKDSLDGVVEGLRGLASGSLSGAYNGLKTLSISLEKTGGKIGEAGGKVIEALEKVPILGWIVEIVDIFKDGLSVVIGGLLDAVFNAVSGILDDILSGDLFVTLGESILSGVGKIFDAITWGGFSSWISSSNGKQVQETIDKLTERNSMLQTAIEDLTDVIKASLGTKSVAAYKDAYRHQQETNANYLQIAQAQAGYHGAHHSWSYYFDDFSQEQISRLSQQIGRSWDGNIWSLSPEEMKMLRSNVDMWQQIIDSGKGGYGGQVAEKLNDYIAQAGKLKELTNQLYEGLTGLTFDGLYDSFIDQLMDMKASTEDFIDDLNGYFMKSMLSNKIGEIYSERLEKWWEEFGRRMEDNDLDENDRKALSDEYMAIVEEAMRLRDQLAAATGYTGESGSGASQSGKAGVFNAMSQDQGTKLEGLFTSVQMHAASIDERMENVVDRMNTASDHLRKIEENTGRTAATLEEVSSDIKRIIRDGVKTK